MIEVNQVREILESIRKFFNIRFVKIVFSIFAILFAVGVLGLLLYREKDALIDYSWRIRTWAVIASFFVYLIDLLLVVRVWALIMRSLGSKVDFWQHFRSVSISNIAKRLPGTVWYIAWRSDMYQEEGISVKITTLASGVEVVVSIFGGVFASIIFAIPILAKYPTGIIGLSVLFIMCIILLLPKTLAKILKFIGSDIKLFHYRSFLGWIGLYFLVWVIGGVILYYIINSIYPLGVKYIFYTIGCWSVVGISSFFLYFMPSNLGFNEIGISLLLSAIMPSSFAVIVAILSRAALLFYEIVLAIICWLIELRNKHS